MYIYSIEYVSSFIHAQISIRREAQTDISRPSSLGERSRSKKIWSMVMVDESITLKIEVTLASETLHYANVSCTTGQFFVRCFMMACLHPPSQHEAISAHDLSLRRTVVILPSMHFQVRSYKILQSYL